MIKEQIQELSAKIFNEVVANRRHLHANPELSFHELQTSVFVANKLEELGLEYHKMADTGLVALIKGEKPSDAGNVVALRADMDALPITEENNVAYKSTKDGIMHACGHDVHTTCLLGAAKILSENSSALTLRYLQTLREIATEKNSTTIFPVPIDLLKPFLKPDGKELT